jgi:type II secretory pathway component PulF
LHVNQFPVSTITKLGILGWRYSWPLCLLALGFILLKAGSEYLQHSPFNAWFHAMGIDELLKVNRTEHSFVTIDVFRHLAYLFEPGIVFLLIGECYIAAAAHKKLQTGLKVTVPAYFTKTGAILQFITLRAAINLLAAGLLNHPAIWLPRMSRGGFSFLVFTFLLAVAGALALLVVIILYYRKLIVEYFKTYNWDKSWLYWLVNVPVIGILVFPLVVLATGPLEPEASTANI